MTTVLPPPAHDADSFMGLAAAAPSCAAPEGKRARQPRMAAADRERTIVAAAIQFFAEEGFDGQMRKLATRMGIKHSVLFRHFATKDALIERVYAEVYISRWRPEWETGLRDRTRPLSERLLQFYRNYTAAIFNADWVRIFMFAGLKGVLIKARYLDLIREHVLLPICEELRRDAGLSDAAERPIMPDEVELAWCLHGKIFYMAIRAFVYGAPVPLGDDSLLKDAVETFLHGLGARSGGAPPRVTRALDRHDGARSCDPAQVTCRRRMRPEERERAIVAEAIDFFADHGLDGQMRELAKRLGVTHALLYRYFPTKDALIDRVYQEVYLERWNEAWECLLTDRSRPLRERLTQFYVEYFRVIDDRIFMRIFMFSGLRDVAISARYLERIRHRVIEPIAQELVRSSGAYDTERMTEIAWGLHGQIIYMAIRRWIYELPVTARPSVVIEAAITGFFDGAAAATRRIVEPVSGGL